MSIHDQGEAGYSISVGIATTLSEKEAIYRLRYQIYVEEMSMNLTSVDHNNTFLYDELDNWSILLYAKAGLQLIGTIRINIGQLSEFPSDLAQFLSLNIFQKFYEETDSPGQFAYCSKLMVSPYYRNTAALYLLTARAYEIGCSKVQFCFGVCNIHLLRLYEQIGWRRLGQTFTAPGYDGILIPLFLLMDDIAHLRAVRSPLYRLACKRIRLNARTGEWVKSKIPELSINIHSQLISEDQLWRLLQKKFQHDPTQIVDILKGLSVESARKFVHCCGIIIKFKPGDYITLRGTTSHTLNILIIGKLFPFSNKVDSDNVLPGQSFGISGLVGNPKDLADISAVTDTEILSISRLSFEKFRKIHEAAANKILHNIEITLNKNTKSLIAKT